MSVSMNALRHHRRELVESVGWSKKNLEHASQQYEAAKQSLATNEADLLALDQELLKIEGVLS